MIKKLILWFLVLGCMGTIFAFSSQVAEESKKTSSKVITTVVETIDYRNTLTKQQKENITEDLTFIVRKGAHFSIYAVLGILIILLVYEYNVKGKLAVIISVVVSALYACSDEFHQTFVSGRSGEIRDVIIDAAGAFVGCIVVIIISKIKAKWRQRNGLQKNL